MNVAEFMSGTALAAGFLCDFETPKNRWLAPFRSPLGEFPCLILSSFPSLPSVPILFFEQKVTKETKIKTTKETNYTNGRLRIQHCGELVSDGNGVGGNVRTVISATRTHGKHRRRQRRQRERGLMQLAGLAIFSRELAFFLHRNRCFC